MCVCVYVCLPICIPVCVPACVPACVRTRMHVCVPVCVCVRCLCGVIYALADLPMMCKHVFYVICTIFCAIIIISMCNIPYRNSRIELHIQRLQWECHVSGI